MQVTPMLRDLERKVARGDFTPPQHGIDQLRQLLTMGPYQFLKTPLPRCHDLINEDDMSQVVTWDRQSGSATVTSSAMVSPLSLEAISLLLLNALLSVLVSRIVWLKCG